MQRFRPKANPEIVAYQLTNDLVLAALKANKPPPGLRLSSASWHSQRGIVHSVMYVAENPSTFLSEAGLNDWIIVEPGGHCRVCHPATFAATYDESPQETTVNSDAPDASTLSRRPPE